MEEKIRHHDIEQAILDCKTLKQWLLDNSTNKSEVNELMKEICESLKRIGERVN